jgi:hypothetical protein
MPDNPDYLVHLFEETPRPCTADPPTAAPFAVPARLGPASPGPFPGLSIGVKIVVR